MKRRIALLLALILCLSVLNGCSTPAPSLTPEEEAARKAETLIKKGDAALAAGKLDEARLKYIAAGATAEGKLTDVLLQIAHTYTVGDPGENSLKIAMDHLSNIPESGRIREDVAKVMLETADAYLDAIYEEDSFNYEEEDFPPVSDLLDTVLCKDLPEYSALVERLGWTWSLMYIQNGKAEEAFAIWNSFPENELMCVLNEAGSLIQNKKYLEGFRLLEEKIENKYDFAPILIQELIDDEGNNLQQNIELTAIGANLYGFQPEVLDEKGSWIEENLSLKQLQTSIEDYPGSSDLSAEDKELLKTLCGQEANKKILILNRRRPYAAEETVLELHDETIYILPCEFIPQRLEEVEYIILIDTDYIDTGETFDVGTKLLKETAVIQVYKVGKTNPIYTSATRQTHLLPTTMLMYSGEPPVYYVPSHPSIAADMREALTIIMKDIY